MNICILYIAESLCRIHETSTTLYINYNSIKNLKQRKKTKKGRKSQNQSSEVKLLCGAQLRNVGT